MPHLSDFIDSFLTNGRRGIPPHPVLLHAQIGETPPAERPCLVLFPAEDRPIILGRSSEVRLTVPVKEVSSRHAQLIPPKDTGAWSIVDLGSSNGTFLQDRQVAPHQPTPLSDRDLVRFGPTSLFQFLEPPSFERILREFAPKPKQRRDTRSAAAPGSRPPRKPEDAPKQAARATPRPKPAAPPAEAPADLGVSPQAPPTKLPPDFVTKLLAEARRTQASDLHLTAGLPPILRINGELKRRKGPVLSARDTEALVHQVGTDAQREAFFRTNDLDACATIGGQRYRLNLSKHRAGFALSFRVILPQVPSLEELGIPAVALELTKYAQGLVLITGPLGSGKTTTMFSLVDQINQTRPENIITIEDPVEFLLAPQKSQVAQRERGRHTASFGAALRGALREDPDIIVIGDLRDHETAGLAISAAETGHLVFASMATTNATKTVDKLIDLFPAGEQATTRTMVSESLRGILCQHLLAGTGGRRVPAVELVFNSIAVSNLIREGKTAGLLNAMQMGRAQGMCSLETSLTQLVKQKKISKETADAVRQG